MRREKPILFNTAMVCSVLDDLKTATRRTVKQSVWENFVCEGEKAIYYLDKKTNTMKSPLYKAPYQIRDILYVRETWQYLYELDGNEQIVDGTGRYYYAATDKMPFDTYVDSTGTTRFNIPWRPSIHMPKAAARIWLCVADVRVERLKDMTLDDFLAEGVTLRPEAFNDPGNAYRQARDIFKGIWDSTIPKAKLAEYGWDADPWVWAVKFCRCEKPKDTMERGKRE